MSCPRTGRSHVRARVRLWVADLRERREQHGRGGTLDYTLAQFQDWFVPVNGKVPVTTPGGTPVVTHHRELAEQIIRDISATGTDPSARTNMFALQAGYIDFGLRVPRPQLEVPIIEQWGLGPVRESAG